MKLPEFGVNRPITTLMVFLAIFVLGTVSFTRLGIDLMPEIEPPAISVITAYPGAGAEDVETKVTHYIENSLSIVNNLDEITSISKENLSVVTCKFEWGTNLDEASNDIRDQLEFAKKELPDDVEKPMIFKFNTSMMPVLILGVTGQESQSRLHHITDKDIADPLKTVPGVGAAMIMGGKERQINVSFSRERLNAFHLSVQQIIQTLAAENITLPAGSVKMGRIEYTVRVPGEFENVDEIGDIVVGQHDGAFVYLKNVAEIEDSFKEQHLHASIDGKDGLILMIQKQSGGNTVDIVERAKEKLEQIRKTIPGDISITVVMDSSELIIHTIRTLSETVIWGGIFVVIVTFLFLRRLRSSLIISLTIPFSLIVAFIFLYLMGYTLNVMSLASMAIAVGMVVDNAVVILENITRHRESGEKLKEAAVFAPSEVGLAVVAATLTTVVIFVPLMFLKGVVGVMFKQLAFTMTVTLATSLLTALTLTPMLASQLLKEGRNEVGSERTRLGKMLRRIYVESERWFARIEAVYNRFLGWSLTHKRRVIAIVVAVMLLSLLLIPLIGTEFIPEVDSGEFRAVLELPVGTRVEETDRIAKSVGKIFEGEIHEREHMYTWAGETEEGFLTVMGFTEGPQVAQVGGKLVSKSKRDRTGKEIGRVMRKKVDGVPGIAKREILTGNPLGKILFAGAKPISIEIIGHDLDQTDALASKIKEIVERTPGAVDVRISRDVGRPEFKIRIDRKRASALGLNVAQVVDTLRSHIYGREATKFREAGDDYDIFVRMKEEERQTPEDIENITIASATGRPIKLKNIAELSFETGPLEIDRKDQERVVKVEAETAGRSLGDVAGDIRARLDELDVPAAVHVDFGGEVKEQRKAFRDLIMLLIIGIVLVYMIMASQFESFLDPFVIMFSVPFAFVGVIWTFIITGTFLSIVSFIGLIMLMGIVVNNGIVLVDYTNILRARGMEVGEAIRTAGSRRLRPVLMTSFATIFGVLPMAVTRGEGAEIWRPLGLTLIGGLLASTVVTLILIPTVYAIFEKGVKIGDFRTRFIRRLKI